MIRSALITILVFLSFSTFADTIYHDLVPGRLHKSGSLTLTRGEDNGTTFLAKLKYQIKPKPFVPIPRKHRSGSLEQLLPSEFQNEEGYLSLEQERERSFDKAKLLYMGRQDVDGFQDCHKVKIVPNSGKWSVIVYFHPSIESIGWVRSEVTINKIPVVGPYTLYSKLRD